MRNNHSFTAHPVTSNQKEIDNTSVPQFTFNINKQNEKMNENPIVKESKDQDSTGKEQVNADLSYYIVSDNNIYHI